MTCGAQIRGGGGAWQPPLEATDTLRKFKIIVPSVTFEDINVTQVRRLMRLTLLAPVVVERLAGTSETALEQLMRCPWPATWKDQVRVLMPST